MLELVANFYHEFFYVEADHRIRDKFLMGSSKTILVFVIVYLAISKFLSKYMKSKRNKKYFDTRNALFWFSFYIMMTISVFCVYLLYKVLKYMMMILSNYDFLCMPLDLSTRNETFRGVNQVNHKMKNKF